MINDLKNNIEELHWEIKYLNRDYKPIEIIENLLSKVNEIDIEQYEQNLIDDATADIEESGIAQGKTEMFNQIIKTLETKLDQYANKPLKAKLLEEIINDINKIELQ